MEEQTKGKKMVVKEESVNPLRNEKIYVRFVPKPYAAAGSDPQHVLFGGRADGVTDRFCVPMLRSTGKYKNVLTNDEKDFLEKALGLDPNALSVYKTENNFWDNYYVTITAKDGLMLDLNDPEDYIKYKVLLANTDQIAPSVQERLDRPKATYMYEFVRESEDAKLQNAKVDIKMQCYKEFGKIDSDIDKMRVLCELLDGRPYGANNKAEFFRGRLDILISTDAKRFLSNITDPLFPAKVLIRRGTELGVILKRGDYYYLKSDNSPLCDDNEDPTLTVAARYINQPSHSDVKFILESEVGKVKNK